MFIDGLHIFIESNHMIIAVQRTLQWRLERLGLENKPRLPFSLQEVTYFSYDHARMTKSIVILCENEIRGCGQNQKHPICLGCQINVPQTSPSDNSSVIIKVRHFIRVRDHFGYSHSMIKQ